jgi:hypothetical protein
VVSSVIEVSQYYRQSNENAYLIPGVAAPAIRTNHILPGALTSLYFPLYFRLRWCLVQWPGLRLQRYNCGAAVSSSTVQTETIFLAQRELVSGPLCLHLHRILSPILAFSPLASHIYMFLPPPLGRCRQLRPWTSACRLVGIQAARHADFVWDFLRWTMAAWYRSDLFNTSSCGTSGGGSWQLDVVQIRSIRARVGLCYSDPFILANFRF